MLAAMPSVSTLLGCPHEARDKEMVMAASSASSPKPTASIWLNLFDPVLAVHTSVVDPLPHQITAVYEAMLPLQPLRFLLADDPGAGKTIMAGLLMKELIARGDLHRCLVVCPGSLAEQWQDELYRRFHLPFEILTNDKLEAARTGNWFLETNLVIARLDKLSAAPAARCRNRRRWC
jgi:superfamily II DNA or RNA helicase